MPAAVSPWVRQPNSLCRNLCLFMRVYKIFAYTHISPQLADWINSKKQWCPLFRARPLLPPGPTGLPRLSRPRHPNCMALFAFTPSFPL